MERWDVYDCMGNRLDGELIRGAPIPEGKYHMVSCVVVRHSDGDFLLMKRSPTKEHYPNIWEIGAGGSVLQGETPEQGARRELEEETGISRGSWSYLSRYVERDTIYEGYLCVTDHPKDAVHLQEGENVAFRWLTKEEFLTFFASDACIDRFKLRLGNYVNSIR